MKVSSKGRYGVRALFDLALHRGDGPAQIKDIAGRQAIPPRFLEQIFQDLRRAGLITSKRGPRGGYQLARPAREIRLGDILRALDGPLTDTLREESARRLAPAARDAVRVTDAIFREIAGHVEACFDRVTLEDVAHKAEALGVRPRAARAHVYAI